VGLVRDRSIPIEREDIEDGDEEATYQQSYLDYGKDSRRIWILIEISVSEYYFLARVCGVRMLGHKLLDSRSIQCQRFREYDMCLLIVYPLP
jgi:hypothetical protein